MRELVAARSALLRFVVLDASASGLPAMCTISVVEQPSGSARIDPPGHPRQPTDLVDDIRPVLVSADLARCVARLLAPLDDLELPTLRAANLPMSVPLPVLLGLDDAGADVVAARWERARGPLATIGVSAHGPVTIDLAADGPNVVIAGEAGVVEALDAVLVAVAANSPPDRVNILLVGTAMVTTAAAALPHTIGVIDDFGDRRGDRLLRWLRTEVRHRTQPGAAAARLVVAVAELGAPAAAGWRRTLLELAATGAAAGVHVVWATERCDVDTDLLAACATRIALQMRRPEDSRALVGTVDAVRLPGIPGRAIVRRGADPTVVQLASLESAGVVPARHARRPWPMEHRLGRAVDERGGQRIGESIGRAARLGDRHPSAGYLAELPLELELHSFLASHPGDGVPIGLADLPDEHRHEPEWWVPGPEGGLLVYGCTPAWSASLVSVLCLGVAARCASDDVGLHVVTADAAPLAALRGLAHVAAVVDDPDQVAEVIAGLAATVEHRHRVGHRRHEPAAVLIIDRFGAVRQRVERRPNATSVLAGLDLVLRDGPVVGVCVVVTAEDERVVPADVVAALHDRFVTGLIAAHDPPAFGSTGADGPVAGRAIRLRDMVEVQFVAAPDDLRLAVEEFGVDVGSVS
jgi:S-DNA-T family DNA segregation ATPase FtsK/SpoIIIE